MTFRIRNTKFSISVYFAATITFALLFAPGGSALPALICCILHESGHLIAIYLSGGRITAVSLGAYGMRIDSAPSLRISPKKEILISLAGPFVNILIAVAGIFLKNERLIIINTCLCVFNLLPTGRTDGYITLFNMLSLILNEQKVKDVLKITGTSFLIIIYIFGIIIFAETKYNFSLLAVAVYMTVISTTGIRKGESI